MNQFVNQVENLFLSESFLWFLVPVTFVLLWDVTIGRRWFISYRIVGDWFEVEGPWPIAVAFRNVKVIRVVSPFAREWFSTPNMFWHPYVTAWPRRAVYMELKGRPRRTLLITPSHPERFVRRVRAAMRGRA